MQEGKYSAGPWSYRKRDDGIFRIMGAPVDRGDGESGVPFIVPRVHKEADARLIAAAPELLKAIVDLERTAGLPAMQDDPVRVKARAAIAKATASEGAI